MLSLSHGVECGDLLGGEADRHDLHRFGTTAGTTASPPLELLDVVSSLGLVCPLLNLLVTDHQQIV